MSFKISYNIIGKGIPIIFIHGIGSRKNNWNKVTEKLKDQYKCITYDLRGHGDSLSENIDFTLDDLVEDLNELHLYLNIKKTHIVGHSLGGMIGPAYARKYPERVLTLTMLSTAAFRTKNDKQKIIDLIKKIKIEGLDIILPKLIRRWFTDDFINKNPNIISKRIEQVKATNLDIFLNVFKIYANYEMDSFLNEIKNPCLLMTGEYDNACNPSLNLKMKEALTNCKLEILPGLKHTITLEAGDLLGEKIKNFINFYEEN